MSECTLFYIAAHLTARQLECPDVDTFCIVLGIILFRLGYGQLF